MSEQCAECKRGGELIPLAVANAKNELVRRHLHAGCAKAWLEKYAKWRDGLTHGANGASNAASDDSNG